MSMRPELSRDAAGDRIDAEAPVDLHNVPATLRDRVEQTLTLSRDRITKAGARLFERGLGDLTSAVDVRTMLAQEARLAASQETEAVRERLAKLKDEGLASALVKAAVEAAVQEWAQASLVEWNVYWEWQLQRYYFEGYGEAAKEAKARAQADLSQALHSADAQQRLRTAELAEAAAAVLPVAGRLPRNHEYAGKQFPLEQLSPEYREQGVKFTDAGFPDFAPHAKALPSGEKYVEISYTGSRRGDFAEANAKADYSRTPEEYTWHHSEEIGRMYLVPLDLHHEVKHTGGVAMYRHVTGDVKPYRS